MQTLYLSPKTEIKQERKKGVLTVTGGILSAFFAFGLVGGILGYTEGLREGVLVYLFFLIPSLLLLWKGIRIGKMTKAARRYDTVFAIDRDGLCLWRS